MDSRFCKGTVFSISYGVFGAIELAAFFYNCFRRYDGPWTYLAAWIQPQHTRASWMSTRHSAYTRSLHSCRRHEVTSANRTRRAQPTTRFGFPSGSDRLNTRSWSTAHRLFKSPRSCHSGTQAESLRDMILLPFSFAERAASRTKSFHCESAFGVTAGGVAFHWRTIVR